MTCRHPQPKWRHVHYRIAAVRFCRLECRCGRVLDEGRSTPSPLPLDGEQK